jgi:Uma2 family endonuclease
MNIAATRAADGLARRAFTVDDIHRMLEAGIFDEEERFELIEGDLVMMASKHIAHERIKHALTIALARVVPEDAFVGIETTIQLARDTLMEPDITVISKAVYNVDRSRLPSPSRKMYCC